MKTIKDIAEEIGVSKTAVMKNIDKIGLRANLKKDGNQFVLDKKQENLIKSTFSKTKGYDKTQKFATTENQLLSILQEELEYKNRQISTLQEQVSTLTKALENTTASLQASQILHAGTMQQIDSSEEKDKRKNFISKLFKR